MRTQALFSMDSVEEITQEAIDWLNENITQTPVLLCFSGGKDSIVCEALLKMSGIPYQINSTLTGIDPPQVTRFIRKYHPLCTFVQPRYSFWHLLTTHNPPGDSGKGIKWCCTKIKEKPSSVIPIKHRVLGIRTEESPNRGTYGRISQRKDETHYHPIYHWREWQIWEFIERHNLPYPSLYDEGFSRIGCVVCPNHHNHHDLYRDRWPKHFDCFERYVHIWWYKRERQGRNMWHGSPDAFLKDWYDGHYFYYRPNSLDQGCKRGRLIGNKTPAPG